jgi:hypothetical protein
MRNAILVAASAVAIASPTLASDMPEPRYGEVPTYQREVEPYEYRHTPPVVVERTIVVRRPVIVKRPRVVVEEYPVYAAAPRVYDDGPIYAYARPAWRNHWHHRDFRARW